jgi:predicted DNA-binding protein (UPF0251 family)
MRYFYIFGLPNGEINRILMTMDEELTKLKTIMTRQGWDYEATAQKLGVGTRTLWGWINEKRSPGKMGLNAIRRFIEENE